MNASANSPLDDLRTKLTEVRSQASKLEEEIARLEKRGQLELPSAPAVHKAPQSPAEKVALFLDLFGTRRSVFPKRWENAKTGKSGYAPACDNEWRPGVCRKPQIKCTECPHQKFPTLDADAIETHLRGIHTLGVYAMWADLHLDEAKPYALFRESTTKDKDKRAVPLRPEIVGELKALRPKPEETHMLGKPIFWFRWPTYDLLRGDLKRAGIERVDALGRSVHFHAFRKTWQTLGVRYGINQRVAQEVLGHSDANLTAKVYTDVPALALHTEIAKLPWIEAEAVTSAASEVSRPSGEGVAASAGPLPADAHTTATLPTSECAHAQRDAHVFVRSGHPASLADLCDHFVASVNVSDNESFSRVLSSLVTSWRKDEMVGGGHDTERVLGPSTGSGHSLRHETACHEQGRRPRRMAARAGIEPVTK